MLAAEGLGHEHADVVPEHFRSATAKHAFGRSAERLDHPPGIDDDDGVDGGVEKGVQLTLGDPGYGGRPVGR
jgi:hypothetical protein